MSTSKSQNTEIEELKSRIAAFMQEIMRRGPLTQSNLATFLHISSGRLSAYLNKRELPRVDVIIRLADLGKVKIDDLLRGSGGPMLSEGDFGWLHPSPKRSSKASPLEADIITGAQAKILEGMVDEIVRMERRTKRRPAGHGAIWNYLHRKMGVAFYREIQRSRFLEAEAYFSDWLGRLKRMMLKVERGRKPWRGERYETILTKVKEAGYTKGQLNNIILQKFRKWSVDQLDREELIRLSDWAIDLVESKGRTRAQ